MICGSSGTYKAKKHIPSIFVKVLSSLEPKGHVKYCLLFVKVMVSVNFYMLIIFSNHRRNFHYNVHYSADGFSSNMKTTTETRYLNMPKEWGHRGRDSIVVGFTTTYVISVYHHWCCEFESRSGRGVQHYVIKFVSDLRQVGGFLRVLLFPPPIKLTATI